MFEKQKNKIAIFSLGIFFALFFLIFKIEPVLAQATTTPATTGCCMYADGKDGCVDGWTKEKCGGDEGLNGTLMVTWRENTECKSIDACLATWDKNQPLAIPIGSKVDIESLGDYVQTIFDWSIGALSIIAVVMIMIAGFQWITAGGNPKGIGDAQQRIKNAIFGLVLIGVSYLILQIVNPATLSLRMPGVVKIAKVENETEGATSICNTTDNKDIADEIKKLPCGSTKITSKDGSTSCIGTYCEKNEICELYYNGYNKYYSDKGCLSDILVDLFKYDNGIFFKDKEGVIAGSKVRLTNMENCGKFEHVGVTVSFGTSCMTKGSCYLLRSDANKNASIAIDSSGRDSIKAACCSDNLSCLKTAKDSLYFRTKDEDVCRGKFGLEFSNQALCNEYIYDTTTQECKFGSGCLDASQICSVADDSSMPVCISSATINGIAYPFSMDKHCGEWVDTGFNNNTIGKDCTPPGQAIPGSNDPVCVYNQDDYYCIPN